jgi:hypothetical protein
MIYMYIYMNIYILIYTHILTHTHTHTLSLSHTHTHTSAYKCAHMTHILTHTHTHTYKCIQMCTHDTHDTHTHTHTHTYTHVIQERLKPWRRRKRQSPQSRQEVTRARARKSGRKSELLHVSKIVAETLDLSGKNLGNDGAIKIADALKVRCPAPCALLTNSVDV